MAGVISASAVKGELHRPHEKNVGLSGTLD
jgi:hypothetical protein